jgi:hypothetical protein
MLHSTSAPVGDHRPPGGASVGAAALRARRGCVGAGTVAASAVEGEMRERKVESGDGAGSGLPAVE